MDAHADCGGVRVGRERSILRALNINTEANSLPFCLYTSSFFLQIRFDGRTDTSMFKLVETLCHQLAPLCLRRTGR